MIKIAVDFDGTIVEHMYPEIGEELLFSIETLKELQRQQHLIVLWTFRSGKYLEEAVEYCRKKGIVFYAVNKSYPEEDFNVENASRKIYGVKSHSVSRISRCGGLSGCVVKSPISKRTRT